MSAVRKDEAMNPLFTHHEVRELIQANWESDLPDRVLQALRAFDGKPITTRLESKMPQIAGVEWRLIRHYGWTVIQSSTYGTPAGYQNGTSCELMLARSEASVPLDTAWVEQENTSYFSARRERNHARMEAMNTKETLDACAFAMNQVVDAVAAARQAIANLNALSDYGTTLYPDHYSIEKACGASDVDGRPLFNREYKKAVA